MNIAVSNAIELIKVPRFSNNIYTVDLEKTMSVKKDEEVEGWNKIEHNRAVGEQAYLAKMSLIENALRSGNIASARECFSKEGYNMLDTLSRYGRMTVIGKPDYKFLHYKDEVLCRSITVQFDFRNTVGRGRETSFQSV